MGLGFRSVDVSGFLNTTMAMAQPSPLICPLRTHARARAHTHTHILSLSLSLSTIVEEPKFALSFHLNLAKHTNPFPPLCSHLKTKGYVGCLLFGDGGV